MLFFLIILLCVLEFMYQYSLESFTTFFYKAIDRTPPSDDMAERTKNLEKTKSEQAKKLIRGFKDELRAADGPVFQKDFAALSKAVSSTNGELAEYMALFQDVPDEI